MQGLAERRSAKQSTLGRKHGIEGIISWDALVR